MKIPALCLTLVACGLSLGASGYQAADPDVTGTWTTTLHRPNGDVEQSTFVFKQEAGKLTGTYTGPTTCKSCTELRDARVTGTVTGREITFTLNARNPQGQDVWRKYEGKIGSATELNGSVNFGGKFTVDWVGAKKN